MRWIIGSDSAIVVTVSVMGKLNSIFTPQPTKESIQIDIKSKKEQMRNETVIFIMISPKNLFEFRIATNAFGERAWLNCAASWTFDLHGINALGFH